MKNYNTEMERIVSIKERKKKSKQQQINKLKS